MDDYNVNVLSEAKNEYSSRLVTILTPSIIKGVNIVTKRDEYSFFASDKTLTL